MLFLPTVPVPLLFSVKYSNIFSSGCHEDLVQLCKDKRRDEKKNKVVFYAKLPGGASLPLSFLF